MPALRPCVLIVEDDPDVRRTLTRLLQPIAHVVEVDAAEAALTVLDTGTVFDALLVQLALPSMSGVELFRVIRRRHPHVISRFIAMTSDEDESALEDDTFCSAIGGRILVQPIALEELQATVIAVAGSSDAAAE